MGNPLEVAEGVQYQTTDEILAYTINTYKWSTSNCTHAACNAYNEFTDGDETANVFPINSPTNTGTVITLSPLQNLSEGKAYRIETKFNVGSNLFECFLRVKCIE